MQRQTVIAFAGGLLAATCTTAGPVSAYGADALEEAYSTHTRVTEQAIDVIESVRPDAKELSDQQLRAINVAGFYRDEQAVTPLLRIALVKYEPRIVELSEGSFKPELNPSELKHYPAARALVDIGLPTVWDIVGQLNKSKGKMDDARLAMYAAIVRQILAWHTVAFLREERSHAPESALPLYDKLLGMPKIQSSKSTHRYGEPDCTPDDPLATQ